MSTNSLASCRSYSRIFELTDQAAYSTFAEQRIVIMSAPNGARRTQQQHAAVPVTAIELADCARSLVDQSVAVLHLHVRDREQKHSLDPALYRDAIAQVEQAIGESMILQVTTEAVGRFTRAEQMHTVRELRPEAVSLALRELCPDESAEAEAGAFFEWLLRENIWPQYILYNVNDVKRFDRLRRRGFFGDDHPFAMLVLGQYAGGKQGTIQDLDDMLASADCGQFPWAVCCFGRNENAAALRADKAGGHVRLGFENNIVLVDGSEAADNSELVAQFRQSRVQGVRRLATASEIRNEWLNSH